ncbi:MAG: hypothetical protein INH41_21485 [Myxococcaceae bacterium]|nr:hypothetical protein [Myxococcaceae bacterium]MCA3014968.1 hypothetical protein [Myxococcaceae bacterium]
MSTLAVPWAVTLYDPRGPRGVIHQHLGLLRMAVAGFALGRTSFRGAEDVAEDLAPRGRRRLGPRQKARRPSDTALSTLVTREGFVLDVADSPIVDLTDAVQRWCLRQTTTFHSEVEAVEARQFSTSMPEASLDDTAEQACPAGAPCSRWTPARSGVPSARGVRRG